MARKILPASQVCSRLRHCRAAASYGETLAARCWAQCCAWRWAPARRLAPTRSHPPPAASAGALDGLTFTGPVGAIGKSKPYNTDSIVFEDGHFVSTDCVQYGFTRAPYAAKRVGDEIHFQAVTRSPTHGTMTWEGVIRGDRAQAEYRWVRERWFWTQRGEYWFKGQRDVAPRR